MSAEEQNLALVSPGERAKIVADLIVKNIVGIHFSQESARYLIKLIEGHTWPPFDETNRP